MSVIEESSDNSENSDFQSLERSEASGELEWDDDKEQLSFIAPSDSDQSPPSVVEVEVNRGRVHQFRFGSNPEDPYSRWPPTHPHSETDHNILEVPVTVRHPSDQVLEDIEGVEANLVDDVFLNTGLEDLTQLEMPPKKKTPAELYAAFQTGMETWNINVKRLTDKGAPLRPAALEESKQEKRDLYDEARTVLEEASEAPDVIAKVRDAIKQIGDDLDALYDLLPPPVIPLAQDQRANPVPVAAETEDQRIDKEIKKSSSVMEHHNESIDKYIEDIQKVMTDTPVPTNKTVDCVKDLQKKVEDNLKNAEEVVKMALAEISVYSTQAKITTEKGNIQNLWNGFQKKVGTINKSIETYKDKLPKSNKSESKMERLPLPKFTGQKMNYQRFKTNFGKYVNYETPSEKLLALKEKCLVENADKERVANLDSLEACWKVLDAEYGDTETTVCDVFKQWRSFKTPSNDKEFVDFVEKIENGVSCLKSLNSSKELTASACVPLEEKLDKEMQKEVSMLIIREKAKNPDMARMDIVMNYLREAKAAAQLRTTNYSSSEKKSKGGGTSTSNSNFRGGGNSRGRGRGGGYDNKKNFSNRGRGGFKGRGGRNDNSSSTCILCEEQHWLPKCPKWQDETTDKRFLYGFVISSKPMCTYCLQVGHEFSNCKWKHPNLGCPCGSGINKFICVATEDCVKRTNWKDSKSGNTNVDASSTNSVMVNGCKLGGAVLPIQSIEVQGKFSKRKLKTMFDNCSQNTFIQDSVAQSLNLDGEKISFTLICTDGSRKPMNGKLYKLKLIDKNGEEHEIEAIGIKNLSTSYPGFNVVNVKKKLSSLNKYPDFCDQKLNRTGGNIDILLGSDRANLHPEKIGNIDDLVILKSKFGTGYTAKGHNSHHIQFTKGVKDTKINICGVENLKEEKVDSGPPPAEKNEFCDLLFETPPAEKNEFCDLLLNTSPPAEKKGFCDLLFVTPPAEKNGICDLKSKSLPEEIVNNIGVKPEVKEAPKESKCNVAGTKDYQFLDAVSTESIGIDVKPKCKSCKVITGNCKECKLISQSMSYLEFLQDQQIEEQIEKIPNAPGYIASYPYTSEVNLLLSNEDICMKRAITVEANMMKKPDDLKQLNAVIKESFDNGVFRWLSDEELKTWTGNIHFVPINVVYKDSLSTPCRLIFDSGQPDKNGRSLNSVMGKGQNPLNNIGAVILNFRCAENVACGDIKRMFHQIAVRPTDLHLRRFYMRPDGFGGAQPWKIAVPTCINFGETAAPSVATKVKNRTAEDFKHLSEKVARMIKKNCLMDDINVDCRYEEDINETIAKAEEILANGKFLFKNWVRNGDKTLDGEEPISKSLGLSWKTENDVLVYKIKLNFSKKKRNRYLKPDTILETLENDFPETFTKRLALKLNHSLYDAQKLAQPWLQKLKLAFRDILFYEKENGYSDFDKPLPEHFRQKWLNLTKELFQLETLEFPRSVVPRGYNPDVKPILILFSDGADLGQCCVCYLVWTMSDGSHNVSLLTSRTKIASMTKISTPRSELAAAQISSRLRSWLIDVMDIEVSEIIHVVDASIILGMIRNVSLKFDTYTAPRVTEIQSNTRPEQWFWIETKDNPSDLGTRGKCSVEDLGPGSMWREGPHWLKSPRNTWPLKSNFNKNQVPGLKKEFEVLETVNNVTQLVELHSQIPVAPVPVNDYLEDTNINKTSVSGEKEFVICDSQPSGQFVFCDSKAQPSPSVICDLFFDITKIVDHGRFKSFRTLCNVSAKVYKQICNFKKLNPPNDAEIMKIVRKSWLLSMMKETEEMLKVTKLSGFLILKKEGMMFATTRTKQENYNPDGLIILSPNHPITKKILLDFHEIGHKGIQHSVARSRIYYWIPQATKIMKAIKEKCFQCRKQDARAMEQLMAPLPDFRLKPSPVWDYSMIDLFGDIKVKNFVNQRTERKTWCVIITCLTTRACWVYLAESCSTDHLLSVLKKHEARNGSPSKYFADLGTQIVGADRVLTDAINNIDQDMVVDFAAKRNVEFVFGTPYFHEGQGPVERLIKEVKRNLKVITKNLLTFGELDCLLSEASYLVNSRPLQPNPTAGEDGFICPNDILFGRSDREPPTFDVDISDNNLTRRAAHKQRIIAEFWEKWSGSYYQSLLKYNKWRYKDRNAEPGDIVMILDKEVAKGKFSPGIIDSVKTDDDGIVRKVIVKYKVRQKDKTVNNFKYTERNVRKLALLITVQERAETENIDLDIVRLAAKNEANDDENETASVSKHEIDVNEKPKNEALTKLDPTSSGRQRWKPKKLD